MDKEYGALKFIIVFLNFTGIVIIALGLIFGLGLLAVDIDSYSKAEIVTGLISSVIGGVLIFAFGQLLSLLIKIEYNTRNSERNIENNNIQPSENKNFDAANKYLSLNLSYNLNVLINSFKNLVSFERQKLYPEKNEEIIEALKEIVSDRKSFNVLKTEYKKRYGQDIIEVLLELGSAINVKNYYIEHLIQLGICKEENPLELLD